MGPGARAGAGAGSGADGRDIAIATSMSAFLVVKRTFVLI